MSLQLTVDEALSLCTCGPGVTDEEQAECEARLRMVDEIINDRVQAALAPIQALRDEISRSIAMNLSYGDGRLALVALDLDAALAAAGVDAAEDDQ